MSAAEPLIAVLDASVLYSAAIRHLLVSLAITEAFRARWTEAIQDEWTRSLLCDRPELDAERIRRTRRLMDAHVDDAIVAGYEPLIANLTLPDPDDRHVLAAAIHCGASIVVTMNLKDFPADALAPHSIEALHPDAFVVSLIKADTETVIEGARAHRAELLNPPRTPAEYLASLESYGLKATAAALRRFETAL